MIPYELGDTVTIQLGDRAYSGRVTGVTVQTVEVTFPVELDLGQGMATLGWGSQVQEIDFETIPHQTHLVLRLPIASVPHSSPIQALSFQEAPLSHIQAEMRRSVRIPIGIDVTLMDPQTQGVFAGQTQDLSSGGMRLETNEPITVGREYLVVLPLGAPIEVRARVLRRLGPNLFALKFLVDREQGHRIMRALFSRVRGDQPSAKSRSINFRRT